MAKLNEITKTIMAQIGHKAYLELGIHNVSQTKNSVHFKVGRNPNGITHISIRLDLGRDTYEVSSIKFRGGKVSGSTRTIDVYVENLRSVLSSHVGIASVL